jgi:hypothetical protein
MGLGSSQHVALAQDATGPVRYRAQRRIAGEMPEQVVHLLEAVEIQQEQRDGWPALSRAARLATRTGRVCAPLRGSVPSWTGQCAIMGASLTRRKIGPSGQYFVNAAA